MSEPLPERLAQLLAAVRERGGTWTGARARDFYATVGFECAPSRGAVNLQRLAERGYLQRIRPRAQTYVMKDWKMVNLPRDLTTTSDADIDTAYFELRDNAADYLAAEFRRRHRNLQKIHEARQLMLAAALEEQPENTPFDRLGDYEASDLAPIIDRLRDLYEARVDALAGIGRPTPSENVTVPATELLGLVERIQEIIHRHAKQEAAERRAAGRRRKAE